MQNAFTTLSQISIHAFCASQMKFSCTKNVQTSLSLRNLQLTPAFSGEWPLDTTVSLIKCKNLGLDEIRHKNVECPGINMLCNVLSFSGGINATYLDSRW